MRSRRSISDIVAVVLLIVIAIAAAVIIYMWLSGLIGSVHTSTSAMQVKLEITGGNVTPIQSGSNSYIKYTAYAALYNPPDSPSTSITLGEVEFANGTLMCSSNSVTLSSNPIPPGGSAKATFTCTGPANVPVGTPVEIVLVTSQGTQVTYSTSIVSPQSSS